MTLLEGNGDRGVTEKDGERRRKNERGGDGVRRETEG